MKRTEEKEHMDDPTAPDEELRGALNSIDRAHWIFSTFHHLRREIRDLVANTAEKDFPLTILDIGTGSGYLGNLLKQEFGGSIRYHGLDYSHRILSRFYDGPDSTIRGSGISLPISPGSVDVVTSTLTLHHLPEEELVPFLKQTREIAKIRTFHLDLIRNEFGFFTSWIISRLISRNPMFIHDAPHSIRRSLTEGEWNELIRYPELNGYELHFTKPFLVHLKSPYQP